MFALDLKSLTIASAYVIPDPAVGVTNIEYETMVDASVMGSPVTMGDIQVVATGWIGTGSVPVSGGMTNTLVTITNDSSITWTSKTQLEVARVTEPRSG